MSDELAWKRANYVAAPNFFNLNHACRLVNDAFGGIGCYLVGSSIERRDHRDVDIRFIMGDEEYARMFRGSGGWLDPYWSLLCTSVSTWMSAQTGLQIDFQIQQQTRANREHKGKQRQAMGIFLDYPGERPSETKEEP